MQNVKTGKVLRPFNAGADDGNKLVLYHPAKWGCVTWELVSLQDETYQIKNHYTRKSFQASSKAEAGAALWQQPLNRESESQHWDFIKQPDGTFLIKLSGSDFYITPSSEKTNAPIILMPIEHSKMQHWKLVAQKPWV